MNKLSKIAVGLVAAATMASAAISVSAANSVAENWTAVYQQGASTSVNKTYVYDGVPAFGNGYIVRCTSFSGGYDSLVNVVAPGNVTFRFTSTGTYKDVIKYKSSYGEYVTFTFCVSSTDDCVANGTILYNGV